MSVLKGCVWIGSQAVQHSECEVQYVVLQARTICIMTYYHSSRVNCSCNAEKDIVLVEMKSLYLTFMPKRRN